MPAHRKRSLRSIATVIGLVLLTAGAFATVTWMEAAGTNVILLKAFGVGVLAFAVAAEEYRPLWKRPWFWGVGVVFSLVGAVPAVPVLGRPRGMLLAVGLGILEAFVFYAGIRWIERWMNERQRSSGHT